MMSSLSSIANAMVLMIATMVPTLVPLSSVSFVHCFRAPSLSINAKQTPFGITLPSNHLQLHTSTINSNDSQTSSIQIRTTRPKKSMLLMSTAESNYYTRQIARKNVRLPLLVDTGIASSSSVGGNSYEDQSSSDNKLKWNVPLPNSHLPPELTTASLYDLELTVPVHKLVIKDAISNAESEEGCCYGHVVWNDGDENGLVGAVGCASDILIGAPSSEASALNAFSSSEINEKREGEGNSFLGNELEEGEDSGPMFVLARGSYRFLVKEVVSSIPFPVAIVEELLDDEVNEAVVDNEVADGNSDEDEDGEDEDDGDGEDDSDIYSMLPSKTLMQQILQSLEQILTAQLESASAPLSPLEQSILEDAQTTTPMAQAIQRRFDAEERLAVFQTFRASLLDVAPDARDRIFAVGMMAGELANLSSATRAKMLSTVDGVERLRLVVRELASMLAMDSARKMAKSISLGTSNSGSDGNDVGTDASSLQAAEDSKKELKVGVPPLPPWANQIQKGIRVEYFWNEAEGWCAGEVVEEPLKIMDEIIVTVKFDDDGSIHRLPFRGDEKARWRPPESD